MQFANATSGFALAADLNKASAATTAALQDKDANNNLLYDSNGDPVYIGVAGLKATV